MKDKQEIKKEQLKLDKPYVVELEKRKHDIKDQQQKLISLENSIRSIYFRSPKPKGVLGLPLGILLYSFGNEHVLS